MASSSTTPSMVLSKGDRVSVEVEDVSGAIVSVRMISGDRSYRGILLQEVTCAVNSYGVNPDRVCSAPYWPSLNSSANGINLKTIPCSIERYSYKVEGQASNLNVFQPDPTKRSHRHQPAPQLSRILRPRRFVCRKCKKAYHVEEHGTELSTTQLDQCLSDSSVIPLNSDGDSKNPLSLNSCHLTTSLNHSQSIRHVTPSIIPKLNENYALINQDSETESSNVATVSTTNTTTTTITSTTTTNSKSKKKSEQSNKNQEKLDFKPTLSQLSVTTPTPVSVPQKKRKAAETATNALQKPKKIKLSESVNLIPNTPSTNDPQPSPSVSETNNHESSVASTTESENPVVGISSKTKPLSTPISPAITVRKNRIKEQYGSLSSSFRLPFGKKCKANSKDSSLSKTDAKLSNNTSDVTSPQKSSGTSQKRSSSRHLTNSRIRNRARTDSTSIITSPVPKTSPVLGQVDGNNCDEQALESQLVPSTLPVREDEADSANHHSPQATDNSDDTTCTETTKDNDETELTMSGSSTMNKEKVGSDVSASPSKTSSQLGSDVQGENCQSTTSRRQALDYEKPKNRWMREARARRPQEERGANSQNAQVVPSSGSSNSSSNASNPDVTDNDSATQVIENNSNLTRLRIRSGDLNTSGGSNSKTTSVANPGKSKSSGSVQSSSAGDVAASSNSNTASVMEPLILTEPTSVPDPTLPSPSVSSLETHSPSLPVIKIKIKPFGSSKTSSSTQYEVVNLQINDLVTPTDVASKSKVETHVLTDNTTGNEALPNGQLRSPSPSLSNTSIHRDGTPMGSPHLGPFVKRCRLPDGVVFRVGDLVWCKLSGWPYWPAQITSIQRTESEPTNADPESGVDGANSKPVSPTPCPKPIYTACLHWFACNQVSYMACDKLFHFLQHYKRFDNKKKRGQFRQAVNEARRQAEIKQQKEPAPSDDNETDGTEITSSEAGSDDDDDAIKPIQEVTGDIIDPCHVPRSSDLTQATTSAVFPDDDGDANVKTNLPEPLNASTVIEPSPNASQDPVKSPTTKRNTKKNHSSQRGKRTKKSGLQLVPNVNPISTPSTQNFEPYSFEDNEDTYVPNTNVHNRPQRSRKRDSKSMPDSFSVSTELVEPDTPQEQRVGLKILLSTSKSHANVSKSSTKPKSTKKRDKQTKSTASHQSSVEPTLAVIPSSPNSLPHLVSSVGPQLDVPLSDFDQFGSANQSSESQPYSQNSYDNPPSELISQFPHVFPDLKATGLPSDTVDIPTFSEDESEEEDTGRLIIDPESISSSSISSNSHFMNPDFVKSESFILRDDVYSSQSGKNSMHHSGNLADPNSSISSNPSNFIGGSCYSADISRQSSFPVVSGYQIPPVIPDSSSVAYPIPSVNASSINSASLDSHNRQTLPHLLGSHASSGLTGMNQQAYFPPSHHRVPSTTAAHNVPYLTTEYTNLCI